MDFLGESDELKKKRKEKKEDKRKIKDNRKKEEMRGKNGLDNEDKYGGNLLQGISAPTTGIAARLSGGNLLQGISAPTTRIAAKTIEVDVKSSRTSLQAVATATT
ncbi:hypothetical protein ACH5RR_036440 [Cinchona calisaya]|uniref:Uncharacterized protein n=1 Tax=Cinchona calisaya TaxID=153742 RepID=A0ABD2Y4N7_9GENT